MVGVPPSIGGSEKLGNVVPSVSIIDLAFGPDVRSEKTEWDDKIRSVRFDMRVQCLFDANSTMPCFHIDCPDNSAFGFLGLELDLSQPNKGIVAEPKFDDWE